MNITKRKLILIARDLGISRSVAKELYLKLKSHKELTTTPPKSKPTLSAILNSNSKHFDNTPELTDKLALLLFFHFRKSNPMAKRVNNSDRKWVQLVQVKRCVEAVSGKNILEFGKLANSLIQEADRLAKNSGRPLYLSSLFYQADELIQKLSEGKGLVVSVRERKVWRAYRKRRKIVTGVSLPQKIDPHSGEYPLVKQIAKMIKRYKVSSNQFMNIHFEAFKAFNSFPRLKDLITSKAIDRLEQGLLKHKPSETMTNEEKLYWKQINKSKNT